MKVSSLINSANFKPLVVLKSDKVASEGKPLQCQGNQPKDWWEESSFKDIMKLTGKLK